MDPGKIVFLRHLDEDRLDKIKRFRVRRVEVITSSVDIWVKFVSLVILEEPLVLNGFRPVGVIPGVKGMAPGKNVDSRLFRFADKRRDIIVPILLAVIIIGNLRVRLEDIGAITGVSVPESLDVDRVKAQFLDLGGKTFDAGQIALAYSARVRAVPERPNFKRLGIYRPVSDFKGDFLAATRNLLQGIDRSGGIIPLFDNRPRFLILVR